MDCRVKVQGRTGVEMEVRRGRRVDRVVLDAAPWRVDRTPFACLPVGVVCVCVYRRRLTHILNTPPQAMTGASVAALCVYDMCKAASHDILIKASEECCVVWCGVVWLTLLQGS